MKPRILIIDDSPDVRDLIAHHLKGQPIETLFADGGREGLRVLDEQNAAINMILLDLNMPEMDGYEFLDFIRNRGFENRKYPRDKKLSHAANLRKARKADAEFRERLSKIKVVVISARDHADDVLKAKQFGIHGYLVKPFDRKMLFARIKEAAAQPVESK